MIAIENIMKTNRKILENENKFHNTSASDFALRVNEKCQNINNENNDKRKTKKLKSRGIVKMHSTISEGGEMKHKFDMLECEICKTPKNELRKQKEQNNVKGELKLSGNEILQDKMVFEESNGENCKNFKEGAKEGNVNYNEGNSKEVPHLGDKLEVESSNEVKEGIIEEIDKILEKTRELISRKNKSISEENGDNNDEFSEFQRMICEKPEFNFAIVDEVENLEKIEELNKSLDDLTVTDEENSSEVTDLNKNKNEIIFENNVLPPALRNTQYERLVKVMVRSRSWLESRPLLKSIFQLKNGTDSRNIDTINSENLEENSNIKQENKEKLEEEVNNIFAKGKQNRLGNALFVGSKSLFEMKY
ncbi:uncharacterized protein LOC111045623 [Nilaparvata lugens]|uniref:uncharacterized protein LOC111045623 n=1 Tax=Nilaparvata lugens TaxID=108931 RepID=UPI00193CBC96|nr:uncharacterized protein LOC111045623 [Nilaparvata lugens]